MPTKEFNYEVDGLSYTVVVYEEDGEFFADITVNEGAMDVNAVYFGDDDFSGSSEDLGGPLNMNGARLGDESVQWDNATELSRPGLGSEGTDKETYISEGDTLTIELDVDSLDEVDVFGIRATSTTNDAGSIKGVSEPEDPEDPEDDLLLDKVGFGFAFNENGVMEDGLYVTEGDLPEGVDPTMENYLAYFEDFGYGDVTQIESVVFYEFDEEGNPQEIFRIDAPEDGFTDSEEIQDAYDQAVEDGEFEGVDSEGDEALALMAALSLDETDEDTASDLPEDEEDELEFA